MIAPGASPPARLWRRLAAIAYDLIIVLALLMSLTVAAILARGGEAIGSGSVWFQGLMLGVWWLYFVWCWTHGGQTVGMRAWRLLLEAESVPAGGPSPPVGIGRATVRFLAAGISTAAAGLGFVAGLLDPAGRCWHDRLSRTRLSYLPKSAQAQHRDAGDQQ